MSDTPTAEMQGTARAEWAGHPAGLTTLFFTEMWERFSYYGMRGILILYMIAPAASGGLGWSTARAASVYGTYTGSVWAAAIVGGFLSDRFLGAYNGVLIGGAVIAIGHFALAWDAVSFFYVGLGLIVIGTGLLKPSVTALVGSLYTNEDRRRDAGFSIFYMGINLGAFLGPLVAGWLAQRVGWHWGFGAAGAGMLLGLTQYVAGLRRLRFQTESRINALGRQDGESSEVQREGGAGPLTVRERKQIGAVILLFAFAAVFWAAYEQAGSTLNLFADRYTRLSLFGVSFPSTWFQSVQPAFVILLAPVFAWFWPKMGNHEPSSPAKCAMGLLFVGLAFVWLLPAAALAQNGSGVRISPWWLIFAYLIQEIGELCISPIALSLVTKLSPRRFVGLLLGLWFLSTAAGNKLAGWISSFVDTVPLAYLFAGTALVSLLSAFVLFALVRPLSRLISGTSS